MMDPLCPELYSLLLAAFGDVQITKTGQAFDGRYVTDSISGRQRLVGRWGETYSIRCPYCDDRRHHLGVSHRFADFPQLAKCLRRDCLRERRNRNDLTFRVFGLTGPRHLTIKPGVVVATTDISGNLLPVTPPGVVYPLSQLGSVHPANVYLAGRGFDPLELSRIYDVHWCFSSPDGIAQNRIIMPVRQQGRVVGWQGRFVGDNWKEVGTPKYYGPSLPKSQLLYGLDDACQHRFAVVCEGVTDVWRVGPPAVAIFGHDLSAAQRQLLFRHFRDGVVVLLLDPNVAEATLRYARELEPLFPGRVVAVYLPDGTDPGSLPRDVLWQHIHTAAAQRGIDLRAYYGRPAADNLLVPATSTVPPGNNMPMTTAAGTNSVAMPEPPIIGTPPPTTPGTATVAVMTIVSNVTTPGAPASNLPSPRQIMQHLLDENAPQTLATCTDQELAARIQQEQLGYLLNEIDLPVLEPLRAMMGTGIAVDLHRLQATLAEHEGRIAAAEQGVAAIAGRPINLNHNDEVVGMLFDQLRLPVARQTRTGQPKTTERVLAQLANLHPAVRLVQQHRASKPIVSAATQILARVDRRTNRVACDFDPLGTKTGRITASNPPLQAMSDGILDIFAAAPGHVFLLADQSQFELRVLAHFSRDPTLLRAYVDGTIDLHCRTAAAVLNVQETSVTPDQRKIGKTVNFSVIFGTTAFGLSDDLEVTIDEAQRFLAEYARLYPDVQALVASIHQFVQAQGYVATLFGRRRRLPAAHDPFSPDHAHALRQAVSAVVQGTAADLHKLQLIRLHRELPVDAHLLLAVHDSVLLEVPEARAGEMARLVRSLMEQPIPGFSVPLKVEVRAGRTWAACKQCPDLPRF